MLRFKVVRSSFRVARLLSADGKPSPASFDYAGAIVLNRITWLSYRKLWRKVHETISSIKKVQFAEPLPIGSDPKDLRTILVSLLPKSSQLHNNSDTGKVVQTLLAASHTKPSLIHDVGPKALVYACDRFVSDRQLLLVHTFSEWMGSLPQGSRRKMLETIFEMMQKSPAPFPAAVVETALNKGNGSSAEQSTSDLSIFNEQLQLDISPTWLCQITHAELAIQLMKGIKGLKDSRVSKNELTTVSALYVDILQSMISSQYTGIAEFLARSKDSDLKDDIALISAEEFFPVFSDALERCKDNKSMEAIVAMHWSLIGAQTIEGIQQRGQFFEALEKFDKAALQEIYYSDSMTKKYFLGTTCRDKILSFQFRRTGIVYKAFKMLDDHEKEFRYASRKFPSNLRRKLFTSPTNEKVAALGLSLESLTSFLLLCSTIADVQLKLKTMTESKIPVTKWQEHLESISKRSHKELPTTSVANSAVLAQLDELNLHQLSIITNRLLQKCIDEEIIPDFNFVYFCASIAGYCNNTRLLHLIANFCENRVLITEQPPFVVPDEFGVTTSKGLLKRTQPRDVMLSQSEYTKVCLHLMRGYRHARKADKCLELLKSIMDRNIPVDPTLMNDLMVALLAAGKYNTLLAQFDQMNQLGIQRDKRHVALLIEALVRLNRIGDAIVATEHMNTVNGIMFYSFQTLFSALLETYVEAKPQAGKNICSEQQLLQSITDIYALMGQRSLASNRSVGTRNEKLLSVCISNFYGKASPEKARAVLGAMQATGLSALTGPIATLEKLLSQPKSVNDQDLNGYVQEEAP